MSNRPTSSMRAGHAAMVAGGVAAVMLVQGFLSSIATLVGNLGALTVLVLVQPVNLGSFYEFTPTLDAVLRRILPFAAGIFLVLWLRAPVTRNLSVRSTVKRSAAASLGGAVAFAVVNAVVRSVIVIVGPDHDPLSLDNNVGFQITGAIRDASFALIYETPLVVLAGLAVRAWLRARSESASLTSRGGLTESPAVE